jgi:phytoene dehydrogenase-like protein
MEKHDVLILGGGHNGLVAACLLARQGLNVKVIEEKQMLGGAVKTEFPFTKAPKLGTSTGAYLLGLMPPEILKRLEITLPVLRRDPHYFLPTTDKGFLLFGSDSEATKQQFIQFFSEQDYQAHLQLQSELDQLREDIGPTWLQEPLSIEETAERFVRPAMRSVFVDLCRKPIRDYLARFNFKSDLVQAMYAVTDGFSGLFGSWDTPGTGMNFLIHNMCRLPGSDGTWMVVKGGMGTVSRTIAEAAQKAGAQFETGCKVAQIKHHQGQVQGLVLEDGRELHASLVVCNADPFRMQQLIGEEHLPADYNQKLAGLKKDGSTFKLNLALRELPTFSCLPERKGQHHTTIHLLPDESVVLKEIQRAFDDVKQGKLPDFPTIEWYIHTTIDPSLQDEHHHHNSALFVQWVPYEIAGSSWEAEEEKFCKHLLEICDRFAPGTSDLVVDMFPLHPQKIEKHFGITRGHIHHVDNAFGFADRVPYQTPIAGLYSASAGCHPAGSVIGAAGHNAAMRLLKDIGKPWQE